MSRRYKGRRDDEEYEEEIKLNYPESRGYSKRPERVFEVPPIREDSEIPDGINDLMNLPEELLRAELKREGYDPVIIDSLPKWYLVSTLRKQDMGFEGISGHIFSDAPEKALEVIHKTAEEKQQELESFVSTGEENTVSDDSDWDEIMNEEKLRKEKQSVQKNIPKASRGIDNYLPQQVISRLPADVITSINKKILSKVPIHEILNDDVFPVIYHN